MEIVDCVDLKVEAARKAPTWRRIVKALLKNDFTCKSLSFSQQRGTPTAHEQYKKVMARRRARWGLFEK
jgi:predicted phosphoadenosine phosphosulfate sulfurtransferase